MLRFGVIGMGLRMAGVAKCILETGDCALTAVADIDPDGARKRIREHLGWTQEETDRVRFYESAEAMLDAEELDGVCIGTRCSLHARLADLVIRRGIPLFLEKPVAIGWDGVACLEKALQEVPEMREKVVVSFPLRLTNLVRAAREIVRSGRLGTIEHVQAVNNVPYGRVYFHGWYRDEAETGGLWLQKATHDFDYINSILEIRPVEICAMMSKQIFKGEKTAGMRCDDCDDQKTCPESPANVRWHADEDCHGHGCCFAKDTGNQDSGSAIIRYETGMHAVYSQNFFARKEAGKRGARFLGYRGTVEFDWQSSEVRVYMHNEDRTETERFDEKEGHGGGDWELAHNFAEVMAGRAESMAPLQAGILSAKMCLKARESCETRTFQTIE